MQSQKTHRQSANQHPQELVHLLYTLKNMKLFWDWKRSKGKNERQQAPIALPREMSRIFGEEAAESGRKLIWADVSQPAAEWSSLWAEGYLRAAGSGRLWSPSTWQAIIQSSHKEPGWVTRLLIRLLSWEGGTWIPDPGKGCKVEQHQLGGIGNS